MRCALVEISSGLVTNLIIANPAVDPSPDGFILIGISDEDQVEIGWSWDGEDFYPPIPPE